MVLSAEEIINGIDDYREIKIEAANDTVYLRPLSKGEWESTNRIRQESLGDYVTNETSNVSRNKRVANLEAQLKFNISENGDADFKAQVEAIYLSMDNPGYGKTKNTREQIRKFPSDVFDEIYENVKKISGISDEALETLEDDIEQFPED